MDQMFASSCLLWVLLCFGFLLHETQSQGPPRAVNVKQNFERSAFHVFQIEWENPGDAAAYFHFYFRNARDNNTVPFTSERVPGDGAQLFIKYTMGIPLSGNSYIVFITAFDATDTEYLEPGEIITAHLTPYYKGGFDVAATTSRAVAERAPFIRWRKDEPAMDQDFMRVDYQIMDRDDPSQPEGDLTEGCYVPGDRYYCRLDTPEDLPEGTPLRMILTSSNGGKETQWMDYTYTTPSAPRPVDLVLKKRSSQNWQVHWNAEGGKQYGYYFYYKMQTDDDSAEWVRTKDVSIGPNIPGFEGRSFDIYVTALDNTGVEHGKLGEQIVVTLQPLPPTGTTEFTGPYQLTLSWEPQPTSTQDFFEWRYHDTPDKDDVKVEGVACITNKDARSCVFQADPEIFAPDTDFKFNVYSHRLDALSIPPSPARGRIFESQSQTPNVINLNELTGTDTTSFTVDWDLIGGEADLYKVYYRDTTVAPGTFLAEGSPADVDPVKTEGLITLTGDHAGKAWDVYVVAVDQAKLEHHTAGEQIRIQLAPDKPSAVLVDSTVVNQLRVSWTNPPATSKQDRYRVVFTATLPDTTVSGELEGCSASHPTSHCIIGVDTTQFPDGTQFDVKVKAYSNGVESEEAVGPTATPVLVTGGCAIANPNPPYAVNVKESPVDRTHNSFNVTWDLEGEDPELWTVYYRERGDPNAPWVPLNVTDPNARSVEISTDPDDVGKSYDVYVVGVDGEGEKYHKAGEQTIAHTQPEAPGAVNATALSDDEVRVEWELPPGTSQQDSYETTFRAFSPDGTLLGEEPGCSALHPKDHCIIDVDKSTYPPGTKFDVSVVSVSDGVASEPKNSTAYTKPTPFEQNDVNTDFQPTETGFGANWTYDGEGEVSKWKVYYKPEGSDTWETVNVTDPEAEVTPENATPGETYDVMIVPVTGPPGQESEGTGGRISKVTLKPLPPVDLTFDRETTDTIEVSWKPADGSIQDSYRVTYTALNAFGQPLTGVEEEGCRSVTPIAECVIPVNETAYPPGTKFEVKVYAVSNDVSSDPSESAITNTQPHPQKHDDENIQVEQTPTTFDVNWNYSNPESSAVTDWKVYYRVQGSDTWSDVENMSDPSASDATITPPAPGTIPGQTYDVKVVPVAGDEEAWGCETDIVVVTLKPNPPIDVTATGVSTTELRIDWEPDPNSIQDSYRVMYHGENSSLWEHGCTVEGPTYCTFWVHTRHLPGQLHTVEVYAISNNVSSDPSQEASAHTKPLQPWDLGQLMNETTSMNISFRWDDPTGASIQSHYIVHYKELGGPSWIDYPDRISGNATKASIMPRDYMPKRVYEVRLTAWSGEAASSDSSEIQCAKLKLEPVIDLKARAHDTDTMLVRWDPPFSDEMEEKLKAAGGIEALTMQTNASLIGSLRYFYMVEYEPEDGSLRKQEACRVYFGEACGFDVNSTDYLPGSSMNITVCAKKGGITSDPATFTANLKPLITSNLTLTETRRHSLTMEYTETDRNQTVYDGYLFFIVPLGTSPADEMEKMCECRGLDKNGRLLPWRLRMQQEGLLNSSRAQREPETGPTFLMDPPVRINTPHCQYKNASDADMTVTFTELEASSKYRIVAATLARYEASDTLSWEGSTEENRDSMLVSRTVVSKLRATVNLKDNNPFSDMSDPAYEAMKRQREQQLREDACDAAMESPRVIGCFVHSNGSVDLEVEQTIPIRFPGAMSDDEMAGNYSGELPDAFARERDALETELRRSMTSCTSCDFLDIAFDAGQDVQSIADPCLVTTCQNQTFCENGDCRCVYGRAPPPLCDRCRPGFEEQSGGTCYRLPTTPPREDFRTPPRTSPTTPVPALPPPPTQIVQGEDAKPIRSRVTEDSVDAVFGDVFKGGAEIYSVVVTTDKADPELQDPNKGSLNTWKQVAEDKASSKIRGKVVDKKSWLALEPCPHFFSSPERCGGNNANEFGQKHARKNRRRRAKRQSGEEEVQMDYTSFVVGMIKGCANELTPRGKCDPESGDELCKLEPPRRYCNGPLSPGTYYLALRGMMLAGSYRDADFSDPIQVGTGFNYDYDDLSKDTNLWSIVFGGIALILAVIGITIVVYLLVKRRNRTPHHDIVDVHTNPAEIESLDG